jgi:hypothetical protein
MRTSNAKVKWVPTEGTRRQSYGRKTWQVRHVIAKENDLLDAGKDLSVVSTPNISKIMNIMSLRPPQAVLR